MATDFHQQGKHRAQITERSKTTAAALHSQRNRYACGAQYKQWPTERAILSCHKRKKTSASAGAQQDRRPGQAGLPYAFREGPSAGRYLARTKASAPAQHKTRQVSQVKTERQTALAMPQQLCSRGKPSTRPPQLQTAPGRKLFARPEQVRSGRTATVLQPQQATENSKGLQTRNHEAAERAGAYREEAAGRAGRP